MNKRPFKQPATQAKLTAALLLDLNKVRILHYAGTGPVSSLSLRETLRSHNCPVNLSTLNRILLRMARYGWLASKQRNRGALANYSLTSKGRVALNTARTHLLNLAQVLGGE